MMRCRFVTLILLEFLKPVAATLSSAVTARNPIKPPTLALKPPTLIVRPYVPRPTKLVGGWKVEKDKKNQWTVKEARKGHRRVTIVNKVENGPAFVSDMYSGLIFKYARAHIIGYPSENHHDVMVEYVKTDLMKKFLDNPKKWVDENEAWRAEQAAKTEKKESVATLTQSFPSIISMPAAVIIGFFVSGGVALAVLHFRRGAPSTCEGPLLCVDN